MYAYICVVFFLACFLWFLYDLLLGWLVWLINYQWKYYIDILVEEKLYKLEREKEHLEDILDI